MTNYLHEQLAEKILTHIRVMGYAPGYHLTESSLQKLVNTSRAPVRAALARLADRGHVRRVPNRGFFVEGAAAPAGAGDARRLDEPLYLAIADDRLTGRLGRDVTEAELARRYRVPKTRLRRIVERIAREGWIERREGRGYAFAPLIDSVEACRESYQLRRMLEPQGLESDLFRIDPALLARLRRQQEVVRDGGWQWLSPIELFETNARFHDGLAAMSGNRFLARIVERQSQLRRLVEYRQALSRDEVLRQNGEHLGVLGALERGAVADASALLAAHLANAMARKAHSGIFEAEPLQRSA